MVPERLDSTSDLFCFRLGSLGGEDSPLDISRVCKLFVQSSRYLNRLVVSQGMFAGEVGVPRLLKLFAKYNIKTTWFIPGIKHCCS